MKNISKLNAGLVSAFTIALWVVDNFAIAAVLGISMGVILGGFDSFRSRWQLDDD